MALAGYNAGPHRVKTWKKIIFKDEWDAIDAVEAIPYRETRGYVQSIIRNYYWYAYRIHGKKLKDLGYFWGEKGPHSIPKSLFPENFEKQILVPGSQDPDEKLEIPKVKKTK